MKIEAGRLNNEADSLKQEKFLLPHASFLMLPSPAPRRRGGMTLVEVMVAMGVFSLVSMGLLYTHVFCLRQDELVNSKLGASDQSRKGFDYLTRDIRSAKIWEVGNVNTAGTNFTQVNTNTAQQGNALRLSYSATTNWSSPGVVLYWFDTNNMADDGGKLRRVRQSDGETKLIASYLTNTMFFRAENYLGVAQTNRTHKGVIKVKMEYAQYQYPLTRVGPGYFYDYYKMEFKLTSHVPDGP
jgi:prepilin-type N-terminal cleavage/methylation domain-containing protein